MLAESSPLPDGERNTQPRRGDESLPRVESGSPRTNKNGMDTVTQAVLGAAVGEATLGRRVGGKAPLWGAMLGTLPDLDVLYPFADPVTAFTWHRGPSHSIFFTKGLYRVVVDDEGVVIGDLRMGVDPDYVFAFRVAELSNPHPRPIVPERIRTQRDFGRLHELWERI